MTEAGQMEDSTENPKRNSRWVIGSGVPRYDKKTEDALVEQFGEEAGWHRAARIGK